MLATQLDIFGGETVQGDVVEKLTALLEDNPLLRDDYKRAMLEYWIAYDGLMATLGPEATITFATWWRTRATHPKTLWNRTQDVQRAHPELAPSPRVQELRKRQATQGAVR